MTISLAQRRIIQNGLGVLLFGLVGGFFLGWNVIGVVSFPPFPIEIDYQIPGTTAAWRAVHTLKKRLFRSDFLKFISYSYAG